jgi:hypothetical protein
MDKYLGKQSCNKRLTNQTIWLKLINIKTASAKEVIMGRIKIEDLPKDSKISKEEMQRIIGGSLPIPIPYPTRQISYGYFTNPILLRSTLPVPIP